MRALLVVLLPWLLMAAPASSLDLAGTWHVLVHYKDSGTTNPDFERWEDRIWVISDEPGGLEWSDYPIVVFKDQSGRFEKSSSGLSRVLGYWEPNEVQLAEITEGLSINPRGGRTKTLKGDESSGWTSRKKGHRSYRSARFVTFEETWSIENPELPRFIRDDVMGSASTESMEGRTLYATTGVEEGGNLLVGDFDRDGGTRHGHFEMRRAGVTHHVRAKVGTDAERAYRALFGEMGKALYKGEVPKGAAGGSANSLDEKALRAQIEAGTFSADDRQQLRVGLEQWVASVYKGQGNDPRAYRPQIQSLARKMTRLFVDDGKSIEEISAMLQSGQLRP